MPPACGTIMRGTMLPRSVCAVCRTLRRFTSLAGIEEGWRRFYAYQQERNHCRVWPPCGRHGFPGSADRAAHRAHQPFERPSQGAQKGSPFPSRPAADGWPAPWFAGLSPQEQIIYLAEAEKIFNAFDNVPDTLWEEEYDKYKEVLKKYKDIKMLRWASTSNKSES